MGKGQGWDNAEHHRNSRKGEEYRQNANVRDFKREQKGPYDPSKEKVIELIGRIALRPDGPYIHVETSSYDGGPEGIVFRKVRMDGTSTGNIGKLWPRQLTEFVGLCQKAAEAIEKRVVNAQKAAKTAKDQAIVDEKRQAIIDSVARR